MQENSETEPATLTLLHLPGADFQVDPALLAALGNAEQTRFARFGKPLRRRQFLAGHLLARRMLAELMKLAACSIGIAENPGGAPRAQIPGGAVVPNFSLSHSGTWVACACSRNARIGLDIELLNPERDLDALARHSFGTADLEWWHLQSDPVAAFYQLWSEREARYKLHGSHQRSGPEHLFRFCHPGLSIVLAADRPVSLPATAAELSWDTLVRDFQVNEIS